MPSEIHREVSGDSFGGESFRPACSHRPVSVDRQPDVPLLVQRIYDPVRWLEPDTACRKFLPTLKKTADAPFRNPVNGAPQARTFDDTRLMAGLFAGIIGGMTAMPSALESVWADTKGMGEASKRFRPAIHS
jgi:hypothetical protein